MRRLVLCALLVLVSCNATSAQIHPVCGSPPEIKGIPQEEEDLLKGQIEGNAKLFSRLLGDARLAGQVESTKKTITQNFPKLNEAIAFRYFQYVTCVTVMNDTSLTTAQKIDLLRQINPTPQTTIPSPPSVPSKLPSNSNWTHNGSAMTLSANGDDLKFYYRQPRAGMIAEGVKSGTLLFSGQRAGDRLIGTAYVFDRRCPAGFPYQVGGDFLNGMRKIVVTGQAPNQIDFSFCQVIGYRSDALIFDRTD